MKKITFILLFISSSFLINSYAQHSVAREWNEQLLNAIRSDLARPTVHARNLLHSSIMMYDAWAIFDDTAETVFLGKDYHGFICDFEGIQPAQNIDLARNEMISYATFRLLNHRFANSPNATVTLSSLLEHFNSYGYDENFISTDYSNGSYAALGNYLASKMIEFGLQDGSNEENGYENNYYVPSNEPLVLDTYTDANDIDPNRWQPLAFDSFIDQSGNPFPLSVPKFLGPEWGEVTPFALKPEDLEIKNNGFDSYIYNDPGHPDYIQDSNNNGIDDPYKWGFALVVSWSSHMDPSDNTLIDVSPGAFGNVSLESLPTTFEEYKSFYNFFEGGDIGNGYTMNPYTNEPYAPQIVKRADYARSLAEFWADGPDSETPPGHWFTLLNTVSDNPLLEKKIANEGSVVSDLEWDVKCYLTLAGAMHDSAVNIWGIKGYYDYVRPISAIRYMAWRGQSSDESLPNYHPHGLPLIPEKIELIVAEDELALNDPSLIGKIKVNAWKGPDYINNPDTDIAGVDWILGTRWWPYQRGTFVTPNFAGYLSGHSTFSRAAARVLTLLTGDPFFPGGMGVFDITKNEFLVFEEGPSENFTLQWATYKDASDQTSLSRIWGGIHPPIDDIRGRIIGEKIGSDAFELAQKYFKSTDCLEDCGTVSLYPVPFQNNLTIRLENVAFTKVEFYSLDGGKVFEKNFNPTSNLISFEIPKIASGVYVAKISDRTNRIIATKKVIKN